MLFTIIILTVVYAKNVQEFIVRMCEQNRTFILTRVKRMCILSTLHFCFSSSPAAAPSCADVMPVR